MIAWKRSALGVALASTLLLTGCASTSTQAQIDDLVADITNAANGRNADQMTRKADELISLVNSFRGTKLPIAEVDRIVVLAQAVKNDATLLTEQPEPTETPSETPSETPTPSPTPTPTPTPTTPPPTTPPPTTPPPTTPPPATTPPPSEPDKPVEPAAQKGSSSGAADPTPTPTAVPSPED